MLMAIWLKTLRSSLDSFRGGGGSLGPLFAHRYQRFHNEAMRGRPRLYPERPEDLADTSGKWLMTWDFVDNIDTLGNSLKEAHNQLKKKLLTPKRYSSSSTQRKRKLWVATAARKTRSQIMKTSSSLMISFTLDKGWPPMKAMWNIAAGS